MTKSNFNEQLYFAYGSNINLQQMGYRCPGAEIFGPAVLEGYDLVFRGGSRRGSGVATVIPKEGSQGYGLLWQITSGNEKSLDIYEGYPSLYEKETLTVRTQGGKSFEVMAYVMTDEWMRAPAPPSLSYYNGIKEGFIDNDLPLKPLREALNQCYKEVAAYDKAAREDMLRASKNKGPER